jgi:hypothetical protein
MVCSTSWLLCPFQQVQDAAGHWRPWRACRGRSSSCPWRRWRPRTRGPSTWDR